MCYGKSGDEIRECYFSSWKSFRSEYMKQNATAYRTQTTSNLAERKDSERNQQLVHSSKRGPHSFYQVFFSSTYAFSPCCSSTLLYFCSYRFIDTRYELCLFRKAFQTSSWQKLVRLKLLAAMAWLDLSSTKSETLCAAVEYTGSALTVCTLVG